MPRLWSVANPEFKFSIRHPNFVILKRGLALPEFFHVITADNLVQLLARFPRLPFEPRLIDHGLDGILYESIRATEELPEWPRSTVDGFAVRAEDTFGASDSNPALLNCIASIRMGILPDISISAGQAAQIPTGGFLPQGADAVVMVEYTNIAGIDSIEVTRPVTAKTNVLDRGEDAKPGETFLVQGKRLRPQEIGFLAALGITEVRIYRKPRVAVISTGDEIVPVGCKPRMGQVRDANGHSICALVRSCNAEPIPFDIVPDNAAMLYDVLEKALAQADVVAISGGSSVGARDLMVEVVSRLPGIEILAHGVSIRPGKPTLLANQGGKAIFGLPGHPVSALVVAQVFLAPFLRYLQGSELEKGPSGPRRKAMLATSVHSTIGLEEFVRVRIEKSSEVDLAHPVFGKSGMLSTMVKADGVIIIPMNVEGFSKGEVVEVIEI
jgi:molybdopterin molybdotransferase